MRVLVYEIIYLKNELFHERADKCDSLDKYIHWF